MKGNLNVKASSTNGGESDSFHSSERTSNPPPRRPPSAFNNNGNAPDPIFNAWLVVDMLLQRWHWLLIGIAAGAGCFFALGSHMVKPKFTATAQLLRYEAPGKSEYFKTPPVSSETFIATIRSPQLLRNVGNR